MFFLHSAFTFGSFDPTLRARVPLEFAGTYLVDGVPLNASSCANGYENAGPRSKSLLLTLL